MEKEEDRWIIEEGRKIKKMDNEGRKYIEEKGKK